MPKKSNKPDHLEVPLIILSPDTKNINRQVQNLFTQIALQWSELGFCEANNTLICRNTFRITRTAESSTFTNTLSLLAAMGYGMIIPTHGKIDWPYIRQLIENMTAKTVPPEDLSSLTPELAKTTNCLVKPALLNLHNVIEDEYLQKIISFVHFSGSANVRVSAHSQEQLAGMVQTVTDEIARLAKQKQQWQLIQWRPLIDTNENQLPPYCGEYYTYLTLRFTPPPQES